ncbi:MAG: dihydropteroate synthase [Chloroflexi bacterium]|nr:dihydropteroate synthase [Chloroflexota bacterium]
MNITKLIYKNKSVSIRRDGPTVIIGERINPTGRKEVLAALQEGNFEVVRRDALAQVDAGAAVLDINAGVPGADEPVLLTRIIQEVLSVVNVPLCIDTANPRALEAALKLYEGKALINSVNGEEKSLANVLPLAKEYGAAVIGLCMDDNGIPASPEERVAVAEKIIERAATFGIPIEDIIIDPLAMTMSADHKAGWVTLETIRLVVREFGVNITMGASNISYGLPDRKYVNSAFIALAIQAGLTCPITNPLVTEINTAVLATDLSLGKDEFSMRWIKAYRKRQKAS